MPPSLTNRLREHFERRWNSIWVDREDGARSANVDVVEGTKRALTAELAELSAGQSLGVVVAIQALVAEQDHALKYELPLLLVGVLDELDQGGESLLGLAQDRHLAWYVRQAAITTLALRSQPEHVQVFRRILRDEGADGEVRQAALYALAELDDVGSLPMIREITPPSVLQWFLAREALLEARGLLGDVTATRDLIEMSYSAWAQKSARARRGLEALERRLGDFDTLVELVSNLPRGKLMPLAEHLRRLSLQDESPTVRRWALDALVERLPPEAPGVLLLALGDSDWLVLRGASEALIRLDPPLLPQLYDRVREHDRPARERLWSAYTLLRLGERPDIALLPDWRVILPNQIPEVIRETIVRYWVPSSEPGTDVAWLIEAELLPVWQDEPDIANAWSTLLIELAEANFNLDEFLEAGEEMQQGGGTYYVGQVDELTVYLSTLGRFAYAGFPEGRSEETLERVKNAVSSLGWTWLEEDVLETVFEGLNVYFFGEREPLPVRDLLFYWQD